MKRASFFFAVAAAVVAAGVADAHDACVAQPLPLPTRGGVKTRDFDFARQACIADGAMQRALVFALGDYTPPLAIGIESLPRRGAMLAPEVRVLDRDGREIAAHAFAAFRHRGEAYTLTVFLNDAGAAGGRLVIAADPASLGRKSTLLSSDNYYLPLTPEVAIWNLVGAGEERRETAFAEGGTVRLMVSPGTPRDLE